MKCILLTLVVSFFLTYFYRCGMGVLVIFSLATESVTAQMVTEVSTYFMANVPITA